jgi:uncharacterized protein (DUF1810 family)
MDDPHDLRRFIDAQRDAYEQALTELLRCQKASHWMWFIFPQIAGLGHSPTARRFAIRSLDEARGYLAHPVLGPRLKRCAEAVVACGGRTAREIFGSPDDVKFRSSMTLFERAAPDEPVFARALETYFGGARDSATVEKLGET